MRAPGLTWFLAAVLSATPLAAQSIETFPTPPQGLADSERPPGFVASIEGGASLTRAGDTVPLDLNAPVIDGDRVSVDSGFVELRWPDGTALFLDTRTVLDVVSPERMRLSGGQARYVAGRRAPAGMWVVYTPAGEVRLDMALDSLLVVDGRSGSPALEAFSLAGELTVINDRGQVTASEGESVRAEAFRAPMSARGGMPGGGLLAWSNARLADQPGPGNQQQGITRMGDVEYDVNDDYAYDQTLVRYGTWDRDPEYGAVWFPRAPETWRPYHYGRWDFAGRYGYIWVGSDPWSYRTHHYGRWGHRAGRWFWIPGRTWAPAWVSWAVGPGYVSWSPLGYDNRPVFSFNVSVGSTYYHRYGDRYDGWSGWTVVPSDRWRSRGRVDRYAVNPRQLPVNVRGAFVTQSVAPGRGGLSRGGRDGYAVPRSGLGDIQRRNGTPPRVERNAPGYVPSPDRAGRPNVTPYDRTQGASDRRGVPQVAPQPRSDTPAGAIRRPSGRDAGGGYPTYQPRTASPGIDTNRAEPRRYEPAGRAPRVEPPGPARPAYVPREAPRDTPRDEPRRYEPRQRVPREDAGGSGNYSRPEPQAPRSSDQGAARARQRDSSPSSEGRASAPSGGERARPNRVPPPRPPRER